MILKLTVQMNKRTLLIYLKVILESLLVRLEKFHLRKTRNIFLIILEKYFKILP